MYCRGDDNQISTRITSSKHKVKNCNENSNKIITDYNDKNYQGTGFLGIRFKFPEDDPLYYQVYAIDYNNKEIYIGKVKYKPELKPYSERIQPKITIDKDNVVTLKTNLANQITEKYRITYEKRKISLVPYKDIQKEIYYLHNNQTLANTSKSDFNNLIRSVLAIHWGEDEQHKLQLKTNYGLWNFYNLYLDNWNSGNKEYSQRIISNYKVGRASSSFRIVTDDGAIGTLDEGVTTITIPSLISGIKLSNANGIGAFAFYKNNPEDIITFKYPGNGFRFLGSSSFQSRVFFGDPIDILEIGPSRNTHGWTNYYLLRIYSNTLSDNVKSILLSNEHCAGAVTHYKKEDYYPTIYFEQNAAANNSLLTSVKIKQEDYDTIVKLENGAFSGCINLNEFPFKINYSLKDGVFVNTGFTDLQCDATALEYNPSDTNPIGTFESCYKLKTVSPIENFTTIASYIFKDCTNLKEIFGVDNVTRIKAYAFFNCSSLEMDLSTFLSLETIELYAFARSGIKQINNNRFLTNIGNFAFSNCSQLTSVNAPRLRNIGTYAFSYCKNLESVTLAPIASLPEGIFQNCYALNTFSTYSNLKTIGIKSFYNCYNLKDTIFPNLTTISDSGMEGVSPTTINPTNHPKLTTLGNRALADTQIKDYMIDVELNPSIKRLNITAIDNCNIRTLIANGVEMIENLSSSEAVQYLCGAKSRLKKLRMDAFLGFAINSAYYINLPKTLEEIYLPNTVYLSFARQKNCQRDTATSTSNTYFKTGIFLNNYNFLKIIQAPKLQSDTTFYIEGISSTLEELNTPSFWYCSTTSDSYDYIELNSSKLRLLNIGGLYKGDFTIKNTTELIDAQIGGFYNGKFIFSDCESLNTINIGESDPTHYLQQYVTIAAPKKELSLVQNLPSLTTVNIHNNCKLDGLTIYGGLLQFTENYIQCKTDYETGKTYEINMDTTHLSSLIFDLNVQDPDLEFHIPPALTSLSLNTPNATSEQRKNIDLYGTLSSGKALSVSYANVILNNDLINNLTCGGYTDINSDYNILGSITLSNNSNLKANNVGSISLSSGAANCIIDVNDAESIINNAPNTTITAHDVKTLTVSSLTTVEESIPTATVNNITTKATIDNHATLYANDIKDLTMTKGAYVYAHNIETFTYNSTTSATRRESILHCNTVDRIAMENAKYGMLNISIQDTSNITIYMLNEFGKADAATTQQIIDGNKHYDILGYYYQYSEEEEENMWNKICITDRLDDWILPTEVITTQTGIGLSNTYWTFREKLGNEEAEEEWQSSINHIYVKQSAFNTLIKKAVGGQKYGKIHHQVEEPDPDDPSQMIMIWKTEENPNDPWIVSLTDEEMSDKINKILENNLD